MGRISKDAETVHEENREFRETVDEAVTVLRQDVCGLNASLHQTEAESRKQMAAFQVRLREHGDKIEEISVKTRQANEVVTSLTQNLGELSSSVSMCEQAIEKANQHQDGVQENFLRMHSQLDTAQTQFIELEARMNRTITDVRQLIAQNSAPKTKSCWQPRAPAVSEMQSLGHSTIQTGDSLRGGRLLQAGISLSRCLRPSTSTNDLLKAGVVSAVDRAGHDAMNITASSSHQRTIWNRMSHMRRYKNPLRKMFRDALFWTFLLFTFANLLSKIEVRHECASMLSLPGAVPPALLHSIILALQSPPTLFSHLRSSTRHG